MSTVFDPVLEPLEEPTLEEFLGRLGPPTLAFALGDGDVRVPLGLLACCRVVHQPHCDHHVAASLVIYRFTLRLQGEDQPWKPPPRTFPGDILAHPRALADTVRVIWDQARANAQELHGELSGLAFSVWTLSLEMAEIWRFLRETLASAEQAVLEAAETGDPAWIEALPLMVLVDADVVAQVQAKPTFHPSRAYAGRVLLVPNEIGHDELARYVTDDVWPESDGDPPSVEALLRDPTER